MKKWFAFVLMIFLCLHAVCAAADARPMTKYQPGEMIDIGLREPAEFFAGCEFEDGSAIILIDTEFADGYLLIDSPAYDFDSITHFLPIESGWNAEVTAPDIANCTVTLKKGDEQRTYHYAYEYTEQGQSEWVLKHYGRRNENGDSFHADLSLYCAWVNESADGKGTSAVVYYEFFRQANNINYEKHPLSLGECLALEKRYPVAAVSPDDPAARVNLREGPGTDYPRCGSLYSGALLAIREMKDDWAKIQVGDTDAYISTEFLTFGEAIAGVPDMRPSATVRDGEWIEVSRAPYRGGGGTVTWTRGGQDVRIMGEYNSQWRIVSRNPGSYYIHADDLK